MVLSDGSTLLARANALLNDGLTNSKVQVEGSVLSVVQLIVIFPPLVAPSGTLTVRAETKGATSASTLITLANIFEF
jgi:hypothetical protein